MATNFSTEKECIDFFNCNCNYKVDNFINFSNIKNIKHQIEGNTFITAVYLEEIKDIFNQVQYQHVLIRRIHNGFNIQYIWNSKPQAEINIRKNSFLGRKCTIFEKYADLKNEDDTLKIEVDCRKSKVCYE